MQNTSERTLTRNQIKEFILRIDYRGELPLENLSNALKSFCVRTEIREVSGVSMTISPKSLVPKVEPTNQKEYVFVKDSQSVISVSPSNHCIVFHSSMYTDNQVYTDIVEAIACACEGITAHRIGLRYINRYSCEKESQITKVFATPYSTAVKSLLVADNVSRAICVLNQSVGDGLCCQIQFGIPNEFYPSKISVYNLLLDIDSFIFAEVLSDKWSKIIARLNHVAYDMFLKVVHSRQIELMK